MAPGDSVMGKLGQPWLSVAAAAAHLGLTVPALQRRLERAAVKAKDGGVEASFDGVRGRKLGYLWRVQLSPAWIGSKPDE